MHPQLASIVAEFHEAERILASLGKKPLSHLTTRPEPTAWSAAECIAHLNQTSRAFLPIVRDGLRRARSIEASRPSRYRRDPAGWLLWKTMGPPVRFRVKTTASFIPESSAAPDVLIGEFAELQRQQIRCVQEAEGLPISRVRVASPFNQRIRYNLYACLTILPRHQLRHLWQARRAVTAIAARGESV